MKRYLIVLMVILVLTPVLLVGCTQAAQIELENRITNLETNLTAAESTIKVLQGRIEQLEGKSDEDILTTLYGREFLAHIGGINVGQRGFWDRCYIKIEGLWPY